ncbi:MULTISPECIES: sensor histidine kinase [Nocardioides]|nr:MULTISPECIES: HAMP domain-containing sensor histidine kinase [unclassified Nocardioides]
MRRHLASLTSRLVLTTVLLVLAVSVLIGTVTTLAVSDYLTEQLDQNVRALADQQRLPSPPDGDPGLDSRVFGATGTLVINLSTGQGTIVPRHGNVPDDILEALAGVPVDREVHTVEIPDEGTYRVNVTTGPSGDVAVGLPIDDVERAVSNLIWWEVLLALLATVAGGLVAAVVVRRQLRPLREVAATAEAVAARPLATGEVDLAERVPEHLTDERTEVGQVGAALNTLLAHVETSLDARHRSEQQVRQFVADASHELRTPLATIAGYTELARQRPDDSEVLTTALDKVEDESDRMTSLVEDLLLLARLDAGRPLEQEPVDLTRLVVEAVSDARVVDPDRRWQVDIPDELVDRPAVVSGDELRLHQVVTNLLTNARKHTPPGTTVTVAVRRDGFAVRDDGPGFPPDLVDHAFERFARGDAARTRGAEVGVGLGLSLVEAIVTAHGGRVTLRSQPGDTVLDVSLPG